MTHSENMTSLLYFAMFFIFPYSIYYSRIPMQSGFLGCNLSALSLLPMRRAPLCRRGARTPPQDSRTDRYSKYHACNTTRYNS